MLKYLIIKNNKGFTLIEVLTAIFLITIGLIGGLALISQTISYTSFSFSKLIASYLAQEGIEIVRNIRDTNWLTPGANWNDGLGNGDREADYNGPLSPYTGNPLRFDTTAGFYNYDSGDPTKFTRKITIGYPCPDSGFECLKVSVEVYWSQLGTTHTVTAQEYLYDWK